MRPLDELSAQTLRGLRGVAFDVDDTLTRDGRLEEPAFRALCALASAGLSLVAVTGRPLGWSDALATLWPVDVAVGENGGGWAWLNGRVMTVGYPNEAAERRDQRARLERVRERVAAEMPQIRPAADQGARRTDLAFDVGESVRLPPATVARLVRLIEAEGMRATVSSVHCHAVPGVWTKATGVVGALGARFGLDADRVRREYLFIGDSGNDAPAFSFFAHTVGVANVRDHLARLEAPPTYVTPSDRGRGFAELAARVLEARHG